MNLFTKLVEKKVYVSNPLQIQWNDQDGENLASFLQTSTGEKLQQILVSLETCAAYEACGDGLQGNRDFLAGISRGIRSAKDSLAFYSHMEVPQAEGEEFSEKEVEEKLQEMTLDQRHRV